jgi:excisionase family DNA binding protein
MRRLATKGVVTRLSDESLDEQRQKLLNLLFGSEVPAVLEGQLLRTADVALLFEVSERTVSEWAKKGQIPSVRTPGGHRRYPAEGIKWLLEESRRGTRPEGTIESASVTRLERRSLA